MNGSRVAEVVHRQTPRGPPSLRTSSSNSDPLHSRTRTDRTSPRLSEGRSPRGSVQSNPRKLGTRIAELESQLGLAQEELKCLKDQLIPPDIAKKIANKVHNSVELEEKHLTDSAIFDNARRETDVFEVPMDRKGDAGTSVNEDRFGAKPVAVSRSENPLSDEICTLKIKLEEKETEIQVFHHENESLKAHLEEKSVMLSLAQSEIQQLKSRLNNVTYELEKSKSYESQMTERMEAAEKAKQDMDKEMNRLTVQTEQWRKAADAAAAVLSGGADVNCRRISERCGSMDTHYMNSFERFAGYAGSPIIDDDVTNDVFGSEKRRSSGIRMLGELWKKRGQK